MELSFQSLPSMEKEHEMTIAYHEMAEISKKKARELVRKVLVRKKGEKKTVRTKNRYTSSL